MKLSDLACTLDGFYACQILVCVCVCVSLRENVCAYVCVWVSACVSVHTGEVCGLLESLKFAFPSGFSETVTYFLTQVLGCNR